MAGVLWRLAGVLALVRQRLLRGGGVFDRHGAQDAHRSAGGRRRPPRASGAARVTEPDRYIAATQLGITMASLGARLDWRAGARLDDGADVRVAAGPPGRRRPRTRVAVAVAFTIITAVHIIFGELTPKWIALERAEATALWVVAPTDVFMRAFWPFIRLLHGTAQAVVNGSRHATRTDGRAMVHSEEELKMLVTASQEAGVLEEEEEQMLHRVFGFADLTAGQVMMPRTELRRRRRSTRRATSCSRKSDRAGTPACRSTATTWTTSIGMLHVDGRGSGAARAGARRDDSGRAHARGADGARNAWRRRSAGRDATAPRSRGAGDRRIRRHGGPRHVRVADGADRRRGSRSAAARRASRCPPTARPTSTA